MSSLTLIFRFDQGRLKDAHESSQLLMEKSCQEGKKMIIVDNTNVRKWEMSYYVNAAKKVTEHFKSRFT